MCVPTLLLLFQMQFLLQTTYCLVDILITSQCTACLGFMKRLMVFLLTFPSPQFHSYMLGAWVRYLLASKKYSSISLQLKQSLISEFFLYHLSTTKK